MVEPQHSSKRILFRHERHWRIRQPFGGVCGGGGSIPRLFPSSTPSSPPLLITPNTQRTAIGARLYSGDSSCPCRPDGAQPTTAGRLVECKGNSGQAPGQPALSSRDWSLRHNTNTADSQTQTNAAPSQILVNKHALCMQQHTFIQLFITKCMYINQYFNTRTHDLYGSFTHV